MTLLSRYVTSSARYNKPFSRNITRPTVPAYATIGLFSSSLGHYLLTIFLKRTNKSSKLPGAVNAHSLSVRVHCQMFTDSSSYTLLCATMRGHVCTQYQAVWQETSHQLVLSVTMPQQPHSQTTSSISKMDWLYHLPYKVCPILEIPIMH